jgi:hypothetical protein
LNVNKTLKTPSISFPLTDLCASRTPPVNMFKLARSQPFAAAFKSSKVKSLLQLVWINELTASGLLSFTIGWDCTAEESFEHTRIPFRRSPKKGTQ